MTTVLDQKDSAGQCNDDRQWSPNGIQTVQNQLHCIRAMGRMKRRFKEDNKFKEKTCYSLCLYWAFFLVGWIKGQFGPSFPDLRLISNVDIETGSWIVSTFYIGYTVGSALEGFLYDKVNRKLMFFTSLLILAIAVALIPWCFRFEAMVFAHLVQGVMEGVLDPGGNAEILRIWGTVEGRRAILGMHLALSIGTVISPLATAPFLSESNNKDTSLQNSTLNITHIYGNITSFKLNRNNSSSHDFSKFNMGQETHSLVNQESEKETRLYIAYSITAVVTLYVAVTFLVLHFYFSKSENDIQSKSVKGDSKETTRSLPRHLKIICIMIISVSLLTFNAIDEGFIAYLSSFSVSYYSWSSYEGAFLTLLLFVSILSTRVVYFVLSKWLNILVFVGIHSVVMFLSLVAVLATSIAKCDTALWVIAPMFGYGKAVLFALFFSWTNEYLTPVTGQISSVYFISAMMGSSLNPLLLGYLMKYIATIWFGYIFTIEGALLVFLYVIGAILTKYVTNQFGRPYTIEQERQNFMYQQDYRRTLSRTVCILF